MTDVIAEACRLGIFIGVGAGFAAGVLVMLLAWVTASRKSTSTDEGL